MAGPDILAISSFIARWTASGAAERANYQLFLSELCDALDLPRLTLRGRRDAKRLRLREDRAAAARHGRPHRPVSPRRVRARGQAGQRPRRRAASFVAAGRATAQAAQSGTATAAPRPGKWPWSAPGSRRNYARILPVDEVRDGWPPSCWWWTSASRSRSTASSAAAVGLHPLPRPGQLPLRPDRPAGRRKNEVLRGVWLDPMSLDPSRRRRT